MIHDAGDEEKAHKPVQRPSRFNSAPVTNNFDEEEFEAGLAPPGKLNLRAGKATISATATVLLRTERHFVCANII